jgi:dUTP pyrophosphatase
MNTINIFKLTDSAKMPSKAHEEDACFDLYIDLFTAKELKCLSNIFPPVGGPPILVDTLLPIKMLHEQAAVEIPAMSSVVLPTGICLGIPSGFRVDVNARSGRAAKGMQNLTNSVGIIDAGYKDELKIIFHNMAASPVVLFHNDKVAQFHLERVLPTQLNEVSSIDQLTNVADREGGLGSTGDK